MSAQLGCSSLCKNLQKSGLNPILQTGCLHTTLPQDCMGLVFLRAFGN